MPTTILLSSSPPKPWAKSPTVVELPSSPIPSQGTPVQSQSSVRRFRVGPVHRDGFSPGFQSAKSLLKIKKGAENLPVRSPGRLRFDSTTQSKSVAAEKSKYSPSDAIVGSIVDRPSKSSASAPAAHREGAEQPIWGKGNVHDPIDHDEMEDAGFPCTQSPRRTSTPPADGRQSVYRRLDWTPAKDAGSIVDVKSEQSPLRSAVFPQHLMQGFNYRSDIDAATVGRSPASKRRKLDLDSTHLPPPPLATIVAAPGQKATISVKGKGKGRAKSPTKKNLTITSLATAHYFGNDLNKNTSPMMDFLSSTQGRIQQDAEPFQTNPIKTRGSKATSGSRRAIKSKPRLLSPSSAMRKVDDQELVFGSASQLVRDECPRTNTTSETRNRGGDISLLSDPIGTQYTERPSAENTPIAKRGLARYAHRKNLWAAAGRDEDNALLHTDMPALSEVSNIRLAFAGKDTLLETTRTGNASDQGDDAMEAKQQDGQNTDNGHSAYNSKIYDVDDIQPLITIPNKVTINHVQQRAYHAAVHVGAENPATSTGKRKPTPQSNSASTVSTILKPAYAGLTVHELRKQIASYGFKPVKGKDKMVQLLKRCWEEKHGKLTNNTTNETVNNQAENLSHGDFLSKVHDVASRSGPKIKKSRIKVVEKPPASKGEDTPKPKGRSKKAASKTKEDKPKEAKPKAASSRSKAPPPAQDRLPETGSVPMSMAVVDKAETTLATSHDIIKQAITYQLSNPSVPPHNHKVSPTWHEKILMYDPIVLEDLTTWLNTHGFAAIGEDSEVSAHDVRTWCEREGICCLWRGGWRGQRDKDTED